MRSLLFPFVKSKRDPNAPLYADLYERAMAAVIDVSIIFFGFHWLFVRLEAYFYHHIDMNQLRKINEAETLQDTLAILSMSGATQWWAINFIAQVLVIGALYVGMQIAAGTTPGRWLLGLKIVQANDHHAVLTPGRYVRRYLAYMLAGLPLMLGILWVAFRKDRRGWHDFIAGTAVISTRPHGWYWQQIKQLFGKLRTPTPEQPMAQPPTEERHGNRE